MTEDDSGGMGCVIVLLFLAPTAAGVWMLFGPAWGLLSLPAMMLLLGVLEKTGLVSFKTKEKP